MPATMGTADVLLKEVYEPKVQELLSNDAPLVQLIDTSQEGVEQESYGGGKYVKFALHVTRNTGIGARNEGEDLPYPGNQGYINANEKLKNLYGVISVTGQLVAFADSKTESFLNAVNDEVDRLTDDIRVDLNRQLYGDGTSALGIVSTVGSSTTGTLTAATAPNARNLQIGEKIDVFTAASFTSNVSGTPASAKQTVTITAVNEVAGTFVVDSAVTWAANDVITRNGSVAREIYGLAALIGNSGTVHGIDSSTQTLWQSRVDSNSGTLRPISEGLITTNIHALIPRGAKPNILLFGLGVSRQYQNLLSSQRMNVNTREAAGGTSGMSFTTTQGGIKMVEDWTCPPNLMYGLTTKELTFFDAGNWEWMAEEGTRWQVMYGLNGIGKDQKAARIKRYLQLVTKKRSAHFVIKDLAES